MLEQFTKYQSYVRYVYVIDMLRKIFNIYPKNYLIEGILTFFNIDFTIFIQDDNNKTVSWIFNKGRQWGDIEYFEEDFKFFLNKDNQIIDVEYCIKNDYRYFKHKMCNDDFKFIVENIFYNIFINNNLTKKK